MTHDKSLKYRLVNFDRNIFETSSLPFRKFTFCNENEVSLKLILETETNLGHDAN